MEALRSLFWTIDTSLLFLMPISFPNSSMGLVGRDVQGSNHLACSFRIYFCRAVLCLVTHLCPTLYDPMNCSLPGSSVHGILQGQILEWVAIPLSRGSSQPRSPASQVDSLPSELPEKPILLLIQR